MAIMAILASVILVNLAAQRAVRDMKIAQNLLVSNIRKIQSYTLSSHVLSGGQLAQYYVVKFDLSKPKQYTLQAVYDVSSTPKLADIEVINFPPGIQLDTAQPIRIDRSENPAIRYLDPNTGCAIASFGAPFGKVLFNDGCALTQPNNLPTLYPNDDYYAKIINFQTNVACDGNNGSPANPAICTVSADSTMTIKLISATGATSYKTVTINGITGAVSSN
jgi:hypothetical protein